MAEEEEQLAQPFTTTQQQLVNVDWQDFATGTGFISYYGAKVTIDGTVANDKYILTTDSSLIPTADETDLISTDIDFDVTFLIPKRIEGEMTLNLPQYIGAGVQNGRLWATIIHYDGSTETNMVAQTACYFRQNTEGYFENALKLTVPLTHFAVGETLRVTIYGEGTQLNRLSHTPIASNTNYTKSGGRMTVRVPFKLD